MLKVYLIRHFATEGNYQKRYIGVTDESLCEKGINAGLTLNYPLVEAVFLSPMLRCQETAALIYPNIRKHSIKELKECDFGAFENKSYKELSGDSNYQAFLDSNGELPFPGGERIEAFKSRCLYGFKRVTEACQKYGYQRVALIIHGGSIMSIAQAYTKEPRSFYHWQVLNGHGFVADYDYDRRSFITICNLH